MSEQTFLGIAVAIISAVGLILVALINRTRVHAKVTREQLENSHLNNDSKIPNIRENIDANHSKILEKLDSQSDAISKIANSQKNQGSRINKLFTFAGEQDRLIKEIIERLDNGKI